MTSRTGGRTRSNGGETGGTAHSTATQNGSASVLPTSSSSSSSTGSGFFRQRNGSGILSSGFVQPTSSLFDRFRRPRTATSAGVVARNGTDRQGGVVAQATDYVASSDEPIGTRDAARNGAAARMNGAQQSRSGLPRSSSSSQVHLPFSNSSNSVDQANQRRPPMTAHGSSHSQGNIRFGAKPASQTNGDGSPVNSKNGSSLGFPLLSRSGSSHGGLSGAPTLSGSGSGPSSGFGRMLRRYSQGAGRNQSAANEARAVAAEASAAGTVSADVVSAHTTSGGTHSSVPGSSQDHGPSSANANANVESGQTSTSNGDPSANVSSEAGPSIPDAVAQSQTHRIRLVPHLEATRSLHFEPIERDLQEGSVAVKIGRFTDRGQAASAAATSLPLNAAGARSAPSALLAEMTGSADGANGSTLGVGAAAQSAQAPNNATAGAPGARGGAIPSATGGVSRVDAGRIAFKSKVVSRGHAEIWCEGGGKVFIRDTKSSSGTFLNHIRLSAPNVESKPFQIKDGDVVQLGVDYQGGTEEIYRCVKMRIELNRGWQRGANQFNVNALRQLRALQGSPMPDPAGGVASKAVAASAVDPSLPTNRQNLNVTDCCICLFSVTVCQALFIAPCSHVFHYKCIRPLLNLHHPGFSCPLCRTFADLEAEVEEDDAWQQELIKEAVATSRAEIASTPLNEIPVPSMIAVALASSNSSDAEHYVDATAIINSAAPSVASHGNERAPPPYLGAPSSSARRDSSASPTFARRGSRSVDESQISSSAGQRRRSRQDVSLPSARLNADHESPTPASRHGSRRPSAIGGGSLMSGSEADSQEQLYGADVTGSPARTAILEQARRPSNPINISNPGGAGSATGSPVHRNAVSAAHRHLAETFSDSAGLSDARTPQNEHFLSTLAEAPPPARSTLRPQ